jgi:hypothetical protein
MRRRAFIVGALATVAYWQAFAQVPTEEAEFTAARRAAPPSILDPDIRAAIQTGLSHPEGKVRAISIARKEGTFILVLICKSDGTCVAADASNVELANFGYFGRPRGEYERFETLPTRWLPRTDGLLQVLIRTRAWRDGQRYTVSEPLIIKPDGTVLFR